MMNERYREMEIRKNYDQELLERISDDFLGQMIDENDEGIDEERLRGRYISLFNLMSEYQKM